MAPGFALVLIVVALAAVAPIIALALVASCYSPARRSWALRQLALGAVGGVLAVASFALLVLLLAPSKQHAQPKALFILLGAGFTATLMFHAAPPVLRRLLKKGRNHA